MGRRYRHRVGTAIRCAARRRWPARGVHRHRREQRSQPSGSPHLGVEGLGRKPRASYGVADPGTTHPTRLGHIQHLHRSGPAGGDGIDVCGVPRTRRTPEHRGIGTRTARRFAATAEAAGYSLAGDAFFDTLFSPRDPTCRTRRPSGRVRIQPSRVLERSGRSRARRDGERDGSCRSDACAVRTRAHDARRVRSPSSRSAARRS